MVKKTSWNICIKSTNELQENIDVLHRHKTEIERIRNQCEVESALGQSAIRILSEELSINHHLSVLVAEVCKLEYENTSKSILEILEFSSQARSFQNKESEKEVLINETLKEKILKEIQKYIPTPEGEPDFENRAGRRLEDEFSYENEKSVRASGSRSKNRCVLGQSAILMSSLQSILYEIRQHKELLRKEVRHQVELEEKLRYEDERLKFFSKMLGEISSHGVQALEAGTVEQIVKWSMIPNSSNSGFHFFDSVDSVDFVIITALSCERTALCRALGIGDHQKVRKGSRIYWHNKEFELREKRSYSVVVVVQALDAANTDAGILTTDALHHWNPRAVLMVGIAAAVNRETQKLGDIILGQGIYYDDRGKITPEGTLPEPKMYPADSTLFNSVNNLLPANDFEILADRPDGSKRCPKVTPGIIASSEKVVANADFRDTLVAQHRKIKAIEMEGYGVSAAAHQRFDQVRCLTIRALCDFADGEKDDTWHEYAAAAAAGFVKHFLLNEPL